MLGFKINGFKLTDPINAETVKFYNKASTKIADVDGTIFWVTRLFMKNVHDFMYVKPQPKIEMNHKALNECISYIDQLIDFLRKKAFTDIKNSSIYILVDHINDECVIKLIDMSYVDFYTDETERDEGFIFGL